MSRDKLVFNACGVIAAVALVLGGFLVVANGLEAPPWLLGAELAVISALAAAIGFTRLLPAVWPWLSLRPVLGTLLLAGGVLAVYVPPQFIVAAGMLAFGSRLIWAEACGLADREKTAAGSMLAKSEPSASLPIRPVSTRTRVITPKVTEIGSVELISRAK